MISESKEIFLFGLIVLAFSTTLQIWSTFKSADKKREANQTLLIGGIFTVTIVIAVAYILGLFSKPIQNINTLLNYKFSLGTLIIIIILIYLIPRLGKVIALRISLIIQKGAKEIRPSSPTQHNNTKQASFEDNFNHDLAKWDIVCGDPQISYIRGFPKPPSLLLEEKPIDKRNSFILARNEEDKNGIISCDIYLERDAVVNIAFRVNNSASDFYMARIDSRAGGSNGILLAKNLNWGYIKQPNSYVLPDRWYHVELTFKDANIQLKINNELIEVKDTTYSSIGSIGIFNEVKRVFVNSFTFIKD